MYVKAIDWIDIDNYEASVVISDGLFDIVCFSDDCSYKVGDIIDDDIKVLGVHDIFISEVNTETIISQSGFRYEIIGRYENNKLFLGEIIISIDSELVPKDISRGDYIHVCIDRFDLW
ncbi:hypothetical protein SAMN04487830_10242 [Pseudobutyrivibrio sp. OR37]|uniref:hypothetical protein n=1 Tax=Pseudobutyrivibrio sp. OR37 TaxID=1798186 RepID=UPI0008F32C3A|nr:hypothetical protein [Pseudobutyrivibrio sp. OR37]SFH56845.1 hypothetical protein SAMN04487830_10242 [Pseudobutyrivibrio sp. OR37]